MLRPSASQGPLRCGYAGHVPLSTLQDKVPVPPMLGKEVSSMWSL